MQRHKQDWHHGEGYGDRDLRTKLRNRQSAIQQQILVGGAENAVASR
jgi:hypothetical protein